MEEGWCGPLVQVWWQLGVGLSSVRDGGEECLKLLAIGLPSQLLFLTSDSVLLSSAYIILHAGLLHMFQYISDIKSGTTVQCRQR